MVVMSLEMCACTLPARSRHPHIAPLPVPLVAPLPGAPHAPASPRPPRGPARTAPRRLTPRTPSQLASTCALNARSPCARPPRPRGSCPRPALRAPLLRRRRILPRLHRPHPGYLAGPVARLPGGWRVPYVPFTRKVVESALLTSRGGLNRCFFVSAARSSMRGPPVPHSRQRQITLGAAAARSRWELPPPDLTGIRGLQHAKRID